MCFIFEFSEQPRSNLLLLGRRKLRDLREGLFEQRSHHFTDRDSTPSKPPNDIKLSGERSESACSALLAGTSGTRCERPRAANVEAQDGEERRSDEDSEEDEGRLVRARYPGAWIQGALKRDKKYEERAPPCGPLRLNYYTRKEPGDASCSARHSDTPEKPERLVRGERT